VVSSHWIKSKVKSGDLVSGETELVLPSDVEIDVPAQKLKLNEPPGLAKKPDKRRNLAVVTGDKTVLVVRVVAADGSTGFSEVQLSDSVFGNGVDPVNIKSQYAACSFDKLNITKPIDRAIVQSNPPATSTPISNGVVTVTGEPYGSSAARLECAS